MTSLFKLISLSSFEAMPSLTPMMKRLALVLAIFFLSSINLWMTEANLVETEYPRDNVENVDDHAYVFVPMATIVGFSVVGICILLVIIAKIVFASSDQYMFNNRYDLVIYKQVKPFIN